MPSSVRAFDARRQESRITTGSPLRKGSRRTVFAAVLLAVSLTGVAPAQSASPTYAATFAEAVGSIPDFIFPLGPVKFFTDANVPQFQYLLYRPLYWFGTGDQPTLNPMMSLASAPVFSNNDTTVTFTMKSWSWSNGQVMDAQDVVFFMNLVLANPSSLSYLLPPGYPQDITSIVPTGTTGMGIQMTLARPVNETWFLDNVLAPITPFPLAWNVISGVQTSGSQDCGTATYAQVQGDVNGVVANCEDLLSYLDSQSGWNTTNSAPVSNYSGSGWPTNPLWSVVDGPWHLTFIDASGNASFQRNPSYGGPWTGNLTTFSEVPMASDAAEYTALQNGAITVGWLPYEDVPCCALSPSQPGPNATGLGNYNMFVATPWMFDYMPFNFSGGLGAVLSQPYVRQVLQMLVDQPQIIHNLYNGYAAATYSPLPPVANSSVSTGYTPPTTYPNDPPSVATANAAQLLSSNGWTLNAGGPTPSVWTCTVASSPCDQAGLLDQELAFTVDYANPPTGNLGEVLNQEVATWDAFGISVTTVPETWDTIFQSGPWDLKEWGGWIYTPTIYPSGEFLLSTNAPFNFGLYSSPEMDALVGQTLYTNVGLGSFANYAAQVLPVLYQPTASMITEVQSNLAGATPVSPTFYISPELWTFTTPSATMSISGQVTDAATGTGLGGICVVAYSSGATGLEAWPGAVTASDGTYSIGQLPSGNYSVEFSSGCGSSSDYLTQWYDNAPNQGSATLVASGTVASASMVPAASISGAVTDSGTSAAVANVCVNAYVGGSTTPSGVTGLTDASGAYTIAGLSAGSYSVSADPTCAVNSSNYAYQTYASSVSVSAGQTATPIDFALAANTTPAPTPTVSGVAVTFGTPTSTTTSASSSTSIIQSEVGSTASVSVPQGALPTGTTVSMYPVFNPATVAATLSTTTTTAYVASYGISWVTPSSTSPAATAPITMTITDPGIVAGDVIYVLTPSGPQAVGTATTDGSITFTFTQDPVFVLGAPSPPAPTSQTISFNPQGDVLLDASPVTALAYATSGLVVSFSTSTPGVCSAAGSTITLLSAGVCTLVASQPGNADWLPAPNASESFNVGLSGLAPVKDASVTRSVTEVTMSWASASDATSYTCTLLYGFTDPSTFAMRTAAPTCTFQGLSPTTSYGVRVVANGAGGSSSAVSLFVAALTSITCVRGHLHRAVIGPNPRCPPRWRRAH